MFRSIVAACAILTLLLAPMSAAEKKKKPKPKKDTIIVKQPKYTPMPYQVDKSGDGGNGVPTYGTGGLNPNPNGSKKTDQPKGKDGKKK